MNDTRSTKRRRFLQLTGAAAAIGFAGCTDDGAEEEEEPAEEEDPAGEDPAEEEEDPAEEEEDPAEEEDPDEEEEGEYTLTITVEDDMGEPVEGATVTVEDAEGVLGGVFGEEDEGETDQDGEIEAQLEEEGEYTIVVDHENLDEELEEEIEVMDEEEEVTVSLEEGMVEEDEMEDNGMEDDDMEDEDDEDGSLSITGLLG
jgi:uncharacterized GH25 family protein